MVKSLLVFFLVVAVGSVVLHRTDARLLEAKDLTDPVTGLLDNTVQARDLTDTLVPDVGKKALKPLDKDAPSRVDQVGGSL
uniref:Secreted protein n=1 Tax=Rhipicephalus appendiculatus TaxID=34631 RepID=A0A131YGJ9_RHIAP